MTILKSGNASLNIDLKHGARISTLHIGDLQLLVPQESNPFHWGCFPLAPWTGRLRKGRFQFDGASYQMPLNMGPDAIHGTTYNRVWRQLGDDPIFETQLVPHWPFPGRVVQKFELADNSLTLTLEVHCEKQPFPAACGWHPWFQRRLSRGGEAQLDFKPGMMYHRDEDHITDGPLENPRPGPWDDCFKDTAQPITLTWPKALKLSMTSDTNHWVVYNMPEHALCVEPMTGPPDALNIEPVLVTPDRPLIARTRWRWVLL